MKLLPMFMGVVTLVVVLVHIVSERPLVSEYLPTDRVFYPRGQAKSVAVVFSDSDGWTERDNAIAEEIIRDGAVVIGVDLPEFYADLDAQMEECLYLVADIEGLSQQLHRTRKIAEYHPPVIAGHGAGATLALAIAAQTPESTIAETVAVDPRAIIPLKTEICTPADKHEVEGGIIYDLTEDEMPNPVSIIFTDEGTSQGRDHAASLKKTHPLVSISASDLSVADTLEASVSAVARRIARATSPLGLPIVPIEVKPRYDTMAVIYSGDGGWRDIDQQLGFYLKDEGIPVVGVDALRYFWNEKTPEQTAADLSRIIKTYRSRWQVEHVMLIGYSFGANILPAVYNLLPEEDQQSIALVSMLGLSHQADFEIAVTGWLGFAGRAKHGDPVDSLKGIRPSKLQCVQGEEEEDSACPDVKEIPGAEVLVRPGGHHFDGDYETLTKLIIDRMKLLLARG